MKPRITRLGHLWLCYTPASGGVMQYALGVTPQHAFEMFHVWPARWIA